jgi:MOSC domain-containing protein YiiM
VAHLVAVCRVHEIRADAGAVGVTAIDKRAVEGPVKVRKLGLYADIQADRTHHGGRDKALYAYADEAARQWADELGREVSPGLFGENLRTSGLDVDGAEIGEVWTIGAITVEVSAPRIPCATFARRLGERRWVKRFTERGAPGAYLWVRRTGSISAGDEIAVVSKPGHGVSVSRWFTQTDPADAETLRDSAAAGDFTMSAALADAVAAVLRRG